MSAVATLRARITPPHHHAAQRRQRIVAVLSVAHYAAKRDALVSGGNIRQGG